MNRIVHRVADELSPLAAAVFITIFIAGCDGGTSKQQSATTPPTTTPVNDPAPVSTATPVVPLESDEQMQAFLSDQTWRPVDSDMNMGWHFGVGSFKVWLFSDETDMRERISGRIPAAETQMAGTWTATMTELSISAMHGPNSELDETVVLPLEWVDGDQRIKIAGTELIRSQ